MNRKKECQRKSQVCTSPHSTTIIANNSKRERERGITNSTSGIPTSGVCKSSLRRANIVPGAEYKVPKWVSMSWLLISDYVAKKKPLNRMSKDIVYYFVVIFFLSTTSNFCLCSLYCRASDCFLFPFIDFNSLFIKRAMRTYAIVLVQMCRIPGNF